MGLPATDALAQEPLPQTHTVRKGDTLWDLAQAYLKDPFLWPGIYRLNTDVVEDPHWIYPGEVLRIAPSETSPPFPPTTWPCPTMDTPPPAQPADTTPIARRRGLHRDRSLVDRSSRRLAEARSEDRAPLFQQPTGAHRSRDPQGLYRPAVPPASAQRVLLLRLPHRESAPAVRRGAGTGHAAADQGVQQPGQRAARTPPSPWLRPRGASYEVGDTLLMVQLGRELDPYGSVVVPTGLAQVTEAVDGHYLASVIAIYGPIRNGQRVLPVESFSPGGGTRAVPVADGVRGSLLGGLGRQELKEPQMVVFIDKGRESGVARGDLFEVRRRPAASLRRHASGQRADGYAPNRSRERSHRHRYGAQRGLPGHPAGNRRDSGGETAVLSGKRAAGQQVQ